MSDLIRRRIFATSVGLTAASLIVPARAERQPPSLAGSVTNGKLELPPLHSPSDGGGAIANPPAPNKRLGVAVVGIGHLSLEQIIPGFENANRVKLTVLVSGRRDKAMAVAAEHGVPEKSVYDYMGSAEIKTIHPSNCLAVATADCRSA